jgi:DmsE family decaheme c-type cytochrome
VRAPCHRLGLCGLGFFAALLAAQTAPTYVGSDTCQLCHEDITKAFGTNPHHALEARKEWKGKSCEACHGPGSAHVESLDKKDIRNPVRLAPAETDRLCLTCHLNSPAHAGRIQSGHAKNQVACTACHSMHTGELVARKPDDINQKCASCHTAEWAAFQRPYKHKLPEGAMSCVDCHNPHGRNQTSTVRAVAASNEPGCYRCHGEKRGPFIYEHEPVRTDGCSACHEPHGSANPRMLTRNEPRVMCLECHANVGAGNPTLGSTPPAFHDLRNPRYRTCADCHVKIHGSNVSPALLR